MKFKVQYALSVDLGDGRQFDEFECESECLPRVGEHVETEGRLYTVIAVFHCLGLNVVVRVK